MCRVQGSMDAVLICAGRQGAWSFLGECKSFTGGVLGLT